VDAGSPLVTIANWIGWLMAVLAIAGLIRSSWRRSPLIGICLLFGVLGRATAGIALFWISLLHLPILPSLQMGDGFWVLAPDGMSYYNSAVIGAQHGLSTISSTSPSPAYVRLLAIALRICGETPLTAVLLNTVAYAMSCAICVLMWPRHPNGYARGTRAIAIAALSFTPSLLLTSTQPLKDQVFALLIVAVVACLRMGLMAAEVGGSAALGRTTMAVAGASVAIFLISGIRAYYGLFVVLATASVMVTMIMWLPIRRWALHVATTVAVIVVLWTAFTYGGGPYAEPYRQLIWAELHIPDNKPSLSMAAAPLDSARDGFVATGGGTNIVRKRTPTGNQTVERLMDGASGLMALFVPINILRRLSLVTIAGGRGLLVITDIETTLLDLTIAVQLWLVWRQWKRGHSDVLFLAFVLTLAVAVMVPMAYVVTNYGTMFRMRVMYVIPLWLAGASIARAGHGRRFALGRTAATASAGRTELPNCEQDEDAMNHRS
jgi:hypothetical protein